MALIPLNELQCARLPQQIGNCGFVNLLHASHTIWQKRTRLDLDCAIAFQLICDKHPRHVYQALELFVDEPLCRLLIPPALDQDVQYIPLLIQGMPQTVMLAIGRRAKSMLTTPLPPPGVDAGSFYNLVESRRQGYADNLLSIESAANNTSVVFCLEWRKWRLLFSGDAEQRSWKTIWKMMRGDTPLKPIDLLKVSHHGSHNGMPIADLLDEIMPEQPPDNRQRYAIISTCLDTYNNAPDGATLTELGKRCEVRSVLDIPEDKFYVDVEFEG